MIDTFKKYNPQLHICTYLFNKPIYHLVIFEVKSFVGSFWLYFLLFSKNRRKIALNIFFDLLIKKLYAIKEKYV